MPDWKTLVVCVALSIVCACAPPEGVPGRAASNGPHFVDATASAGLSQLAPPPPLMDQILGSIGSGVTVGDYDGDGDEDLYFPHQPTVAEHLAGRPGRPNELYRNNGDGTFTEVAGEAGVALQAWSNSAYFADYDNDGDQDLFVANWGRNTFYANNGDGTFDDRTESTGLGGDDEWTSAAAFADLDDDGLLDLYVVNYCDYDPGDPLQSGIRPVWHGLDVWVGPTGLPGQVDRLYRNAGDATFNDLTEHSGLPRQPGYYGLGVVAADLDRDKDLDLYVANDSVVNQMWRNDGRMPFVEIGAQSGTATNENADAQAGRGVDAADYDGDGLVDLFVTNLSHNWNTLYVNEGGMRFRDATFEARLAGSWNSAGWGAKFFDFDHDGWLDLGIANGHVYPQVDAHAQTATTLRQPDRLLRNSADGRFEPIDDAAWSQARISRGLALLDYDLDGDVDVVITHLDAPASLLRNDGGNARNWISVRLVGVRSSRDAVGARLEIEIPGRTLTRLVNPYGSFQSQSSAAVHFGLGHAEFIDRLTIVWPSRRTQEFTDLRANRFYTIREDSGIASVIDPAESKP